MLLNIVSSKFFRFISLSENFRPQKKAERIHQNQKLTINT